MAIDLLQHPELSRKSFRLVHWGRYVFTLCSACPICAVPLPSILIPLVGPFREPSYLRGLGIVVLSSRSLDQAFELGLIACWQTFVIVHAAILRSKSVLLPRLLTVDLSLSLRGGAYCAPDAHDLPTYATESSSHKKRRLLDIIIGDPAAASSVLELESDSTQRTKMWKCNNRAQRTKFI
ncbi:unnamed protein product [Albugo candida]|uniref:Uncharacterized protein n=1 Tax=Albugo candida TaxID=65357 RepID=A0A024GUQ1_9STRA|nr:unnamed protein product [Albugo candida]|eukprot:CCI50708.1 unnamed protein product [Albugo candida]